MTIASEVNVERYVGDGLVTNFPFNFVISDEDHLEVIVADTNDVQNLLVLNVDYTVAGVGEIAGGSITYPIPLELPLITPDPLPAGYKLSIRRVVPLLQETNFFKHGPFNPETIEDSLDYLTEGLQQLSEELSRAPKATITSGLLGDVYMAQIVVASGSASSSAAAAANSAISANANALASAASAAAALASENSAIIAANSAAASAASIIGEVDSAIIAANSASVSAAAASASSDTAVIAANSASVSAAAASASSDTAVIAAASAVLNSGINGTVAWPEGRNSVDIVFPEALADNSYVPVISVTAPDESDIFWPIFTIPSTRKTREGFTVRANCTIDVTGYYINYRI